MSREPHTIRPVKGEAQPKAWLAVETWSRLEPHPALINLEIERLESWHACSSVSNGKGGYTTREESGTDALSFWRLIERALKRGVVTWLFAMPASRVLSLLGFWDELESGRIYLSERDHRNAHTDPGRDLSRMRPSADGDDCAELLPPDDNLPQMRSGVHLSSTAARQRGGNPRAGAVGYCVLEDPPTIIQCRRRGRAGILKIVDLRNYGYSGSDAPAESADRARWIRDTVLAMIRTLADHGMGGLQNTAASQAFYTWRKCYLTHPVEVHCYPEALHLEREAYYGGRTEAGIIGSRDGPVFHLDFRGFYGGIGATLSVPVRLVGYVNYGGPERISAGMPLHRCIARVGIKCKTPAYPLRRAGLTLFPTGRFCTTLAGPELAAAQALGHVQRIYEVAEYELAPACSAFATSLSALRSAAECSGNHAGAEFAKRLGVSLYGKLAQTDSRWVDTTARDADSPYDAWYEVAEDGELERWRAIGWHVQREWKSRPGAKPEKGSHAYWAWASKVLQRETGESCPAMAAFVTSAGRLLLWRAICAAGQGNVYYYDTDSLFVSQAGYDSLLRSGLVGGAGAPQLTLRNTIARLDVRGYKHYLADGIVTCSGIPKGEHSPGPDRESYYLRAWIARHINAGRAPRAERAKLLYARSSPYLHGRVTESGIVEPWELP